MELFISRDSEGKSAYARARARQDVLEALHEALESTGISQTELARRLGIRKGAVNQVLKGNGNLRISTLAEYLAALNLQVRITVEEFNFGLSDRDVIEDDSNEPKRKMDGRWLFSSGNGVSEHSVYTDADPDAEFIGTSIEFTVSSTSKPTTESQIPVEGRAHADI